MNIHFNFPYSVFEFTVFVIPFNIIKFILKIEKTGEYIEVIFFSNFFVFASSLGQSSSEYSTFRDTQCIHS